MLFKDMKKIKNDMSMNIRETLEAELRAFHDQLHYLETKRQEIESKNKKKKNMIRIVFNKYKTQLSILVQKRKLMMKQVVILSTYVLFPVMKTALINT